MTFTTPNFAVEIKDKVAHVIFNRPDAFNAMDAGFWNGLPEIINDISLNARARCIVLSAKGRHFSAGMDLSVFKEDSESIHGAGDDRYLRSEAFARNVRLLQDCFSSLEKARMPVIAAIHGGCIGGAVDLACAADFRFATRDAFFCIQEINLAMVADVGTFPRILNLIPEGWVRQLAYTGERLPAEKAASLGLVNELFETHDAMVDRALDVAAAIARKDPLAIAGSKEVINYARDHSTEDSLRFVGVWNSAFFAPERVQQAATAAREGKDPGFEDLYPVRAKPM